MTDDPNDAYDVAPIPADEPLSAQGWWTCFQNGVPQWHGPEARMKQLATDPAERAEARRSKKHHDRKPV